METNKTRDQLVTQNMGYVVTLARQYSSELLTADDLVSEGTIGIIKAAEKFDPAIGKPFVTFAAPYIRRSIEEAISRVTRQTTVMSTDEGLPVGSNNHFTLLHVLEDRDAPQADRQLEQVMLSDQLVGAIRFLNEREQAVVCRYYGIRQPRQTMAEIGLTLGLKRERVRQIRDKAVRKLRRTAQREE